MSNFGNAIAGGATGAGIGSAFGPVSAGIGGLLGGLGGLLGLGKGKSEKIKRFDPYDQQQRAYLNQLLQGAQSGNQNAMQYLNSILSNDEQAYNDFEAPEMQRFQQQTVPGIMERFSGMGAQSSSALNQTLGQAGQDLSLGLAQQRAGLKQNALQQLLGMGQQGLTPQHYYTKGGQQSLWGQLAPAASQGFLQGSQGGQFSGILDWLSNKLSSGGTSAPATSRGVTGGHGLPGFMQF